MKNEICQRRVVITGIGVISACGLTVDDFWESVIKGKSGGTPITRFDTARLPTKIAAEISNFDCGNYISPKKSKRYDLGMQYSVAASLEAVADARLRIEKMDADRIGLMHANSLEGMESAFNAYPVFAEFGYKKIGPAYLLNNYFGAASGELAYIHGIKGHAITYSSGSASGSDVMTLAADMIRADDVDVMLVGASEAPILIQLVAGFCNARVLTTRNEDPKRAMRSFDEGRDGFLLGEGGAFLVLEEYTVAKERGARIYAEFVAGGRACEAYHPVNIHPDGLGTIACMDRALRKARLDLTEVSYINAHATATSVNDKVEAETIKKYFGSHAAKITVNATKPVTGHLLAAGGALETAICALAVHRQMIPPTINLAQPVDGSQLDFNCGGARPYPVNVAMNINAGFGGKNSCVILKRVEG